MSHHHFWCFLLSFPELGLLKTLLEVSVFAASSGALVLIPAPERRIGGLLLSHVWRTISDGSVFEPTRAVCKSEAIGSSGALYVPPSCGWLDVVSSSFLYMVTLVILFFFPTCKLLFTIVAVQNLGRARLFRPPPLGSLPWLLGPGLL